MIYVNQIIRLLTLFLSFDNWFRKTFSEQSSNQVPSDEWLSELRDDATAAAACLLTAAAFAAAAMATTDCCCNIYEAKFDDIDECGVVDAVPVVKEEAEQCIPGGIPDVEWSKDPIERNGKEVWCPG